MAYPRWLITDVMPAGGTSMLYGRSGTGKSFCALDMACCIATGQDWAGHKVERGPVVYVAGEGRQGYAARRQAWEAKHKAQADAFYLEDEPVRLWRNRDSVDRFVSGVNAAGVHPVLIVFDTLATCYGGADENSNGNMRELLDAAEDIARPWNAAVLFIHHNGKQGESARGAQALQDGVAMQAYFHGDGKTYGALQCMKQKDGEPFQPIRRTLFRAASSLAFADDHATGPRAESKRVSWPEVRAQLATASAPMTPAMVARVLNCDRKAVQAHLLRAFERGEVERDEAGGYFPAELRMAA
jgi:hypothetical protein